LLHRFNPQLSLLLRLLTVAGFKTFGIAKSIVLFALVAAGRDVRVLLADDDADDRDFFMDAVSEVAPNVKVETVTNGEQLIHRLSNGLPLPHIIFLDLNMPVKDGHECLEEIRGNDKFRHIPIVIYSTSSSNEHIEETYAGGASLYVRKPDSFGDLKAIAKKILTLDWDDHQRPSRENFYLTAKTF